MKDFNYFMPHAGRFQLVWNRRQADWQTWNKSIGTHGGKARTVRRYAVEFKHPLR